MTPETAEYLRLRRLTRERRAATQRWMAAHAVSLQDVTL